MRFRGQLSQLFFFYRQRYLIKKVCRHFFFYTTGCISSVSAAFCSLIFLGNESGSYSVNCSSMMSSWSFIFWIGLSVTTGKISSMYLKCSFHFCCLSSGLVAVTFAFEVLLLRLTSFTVYSVSHNCPSITEFQVLWIWFLMYSSCALTYVLVRSKLS